MSTPWIPCGIALTPVQHVLISIAHHPAQPNKRIGLLVCNPKRQYLYRDFWGYVIWPYPSGDLNHRYAVSTRQGELTATLPPGFTHEEYIPLVRTLVAQAKAHGHVFPEERRNSPLPLVI